MAASRSERGPVWRITIGFIKYGLYLALLGFVALAVAVGIAMSSLPDYETLRSSPNGQTVRVRAADGSVIFALGPSYGQWLDYEEIPPVMRDAMISVEDRRYDSHLGVDPIGIARSVQVRVQQGAWTQGGSTITQQLARNLFLTNTRTFGRKVREVILALAMERSFSKEQILELYLNRVYFGGGAYGIDAASRRFFGHSARELSLSEASVIAGLVKAPSRYSPTADAEAAVGRAGVVLDLMVETGHITAAQAAAAQPDDVSLAPQPRRNSVRYFTDWTLNQLDTLIDETRAPIDVWTTIDLEMQARAVESIRNFVPDGAQGALVAVDRDGAVRAMVGGTDYVTSNYNRAVTAVRQPGSSWKLFVYLAALENGYTPADRVVDEPVDWNGWQPRNSSGRYAGEMDIRTAFAYSVNTIAAQLGAEVGTHNVANMAQRFGITTPVNTHPSMVLGTSEVRVIDMVGAFASVAARGIAVDPYGIVKVTMEDPRNNEEIELFRAEIDQSRVLVAPYVAAEMTDLLQTAVATGTGRAAQIGRPVAGKTGTTSSNKDGWFIGFSSGMTTAVWMGRDDARAVSGLQGGRAPARAFAHFMSYAVSNRPIEEFDTDVTLPDWQLEGEDDAYFGDPFEDEIFVDENGMPIGDPDAYRDQRPYDGAEAPDDMGEEWIDDVLRRRERPRRGERPGDRQGDRPDERSGERPYDRVPPPENVPSREPPAAIRPQEEQPIR
ncbi:MAG: PBP1A family penicillin-binding protein [Sphingomonadaceae bacterium]|nr:PBP1A family penicillin-binding protein [Sphingomonadaceae bacterium]